MGNRNVLHLLVFMLVTCSVGEVRCAIIGERGSSLILNPHTRGTLEEIVWTHNGNKVVDYDQQQIVQFDPFKKRIILDLRSGELTIKRLQAGDDGVYESTAVVDGKTQYSKHNLQVIDTVPQPKVTCKEADPGAEEETLLCSVDVDIPVTYRWRGPTVYDHPGAQLRLGKEEDPDSTFTCFVKNEISEKYVSFTLRDCQPGGISPGIIAAIVLSVICALCLLILIPLLVCRAQKKKPRKNQTYNQVDIENGESKNLLSAGVPTDNDTDEGGKKRKAKGLFRAVHRKEKSGSGLEDTDNEENTSFSLRATLPSHAKLRPARAVHERANGTREAKDVNSPDKSTVNGLQQEDQRAEKSIPVSVEMATLDQRAVEVQPELHGTESAPAVISTFSSSAEEPDMQLDAVNHSKDQPMDEDEELPHGSPEGLPEEIKTYHSHNVTVTIEGKDRRESYEEEEENVSGTERGTDLMSESGATEEREGNRPRTDTENSQEEESLKQGMVGEDVHLPVQVNHEMAVEESSVDNEKNVEIVHPIQIEEGEANGSELKEELPEVKQDLQEHLKEDTRKDEKENEQDDQHEAELDPQTDSLGEEEDSSTAQERGRTTEDEDEEEDILTKEQPLRENEHGSRTPEAQEKTEPDVLQDQTRDGEEQEPHVNKSLDEERTEEYEGEDSKMDLERKCPDEREREIESAVEQGDGVDDNTNQREENELRPEDGHESDEDTVSVNSEPEYQLLREGSDTSLEEEQQIDCQDVSVTDETNDEESEIKSETKANAAVEDKKLEGQTLLKEEEDQTMPKEDTVAIKERDSLPEDLDSLPEYQDHQDVSVTEEKTDEDSEIKVENGGVENNTQLEEKQQEEQNPLRQGEDDCMPKEKPVALEEQDRLPEDQRIGKDISDNDETQDDNEQDIKTEMINNHGQAKDLLEKEFKEEQTEQDQQLKEFKEEQSKQDQQQNDTNRPVLHENVEEDEKTDIEKENEHSQEEDRQKDVLPKSESEEEDMDTSGQLQNEEHLEREGGEEERGQHVDTNLEGRQDDKNIPDSDGEQDLEDVRQTNDMHLAKEKSEDDAQLKEVCKLEKGDVCEVNADKVQEDPAEDNEKVVDEKKHHGPEDQMAEDVCDLSEIENPYPVGEKDEERMQARTVKDGQKDDLHNSTSDENKNKVDEKDVEMNLNREPDKETLLEEERGDTVVHQGQTDGEQLQTEVPGQLQNELSQLEHHDDDDDPVKGKGLEEDDQMKHQMEQLHSKNDENNKDGRDIVPENEERNDSQSEKERKEKVEMHQDGIGQSQTEQVIESSPQKLKQSEEIKDLEEKKEL
ncbi:trichohyalin-like [Sardina pilchardus]|uniref:trichohyalin-like n=1 Tax=Sardina pilchardus TaxID=27697 RepID=UPI002E121848